MPATRIVKVVAKVKKSKQGKKNNNNQRQAVSVPRRIESSLTIRMPSMPLFPPRSKVMMLPYFTNNLLTVPANTSATSYVFSANGPYDPDISGIGSQPMGFDQMMVFYEHFTVVSATAIVTFHNNLTSSTPDIMLGARADTTTISDAYTLMELGNSVSSKLNINSVANGVQELRLKVDIARFLGIDDLLDSAVARGTISANPSEQVYFHVSAWNVETSVAGQIAFEIRLEYHCIFTEPRDITRSMAKQMKSLIVQESKETIVL
jgi:hypothetical protein